MSQCQTFSLQRLGLDEGSAASLDELKKDIAPGAVLDTIERRKAASPNPGSEPEPG
jgi:hypothetical protein